MAEEPATFRIRDDVPIARLTLDPARDALLTGRIEALLGTSLPTPGRPSGDDPLLVWQGPSDTLVVGLRPDIDAVIAGRAALLGDAGAGLALIEVSGAIDPWLAHDLPPETAITSRVMRFAGLRVTALRFPATPPRAWLLVDRSAAAYAGRWLEERWRIRAGT